MAVPHSSEARHFPFAPVSNDSGHKASLLVLNQAELYPGLSRVEETDVRHPFGTVLSHNEGLTE